MFNLKQANLEKESALFAEQMLRQYLWSYAKNNTLEPFVIEVLRRDPPSTYQEIKAVFNQTVKTAYNYIDDLLEKIKQTMGYLLNQKPFDSKTYADLETRYRLLRQKRYPPYNESAPDVQAARAALSKANASLTPVPNIDVEDTSKMVGFHQWENTVGGKGGFLSISKIPNTDPGQPEWVVLPDLKFMGTGGNRPSKASLYIKDKMGDDLVLVPKGNDPNWPEFDTKIRGTIEAWNRFVQFAPYVFDNTNNLPTAKSLGLKSEKDYDPNYSTTEEKSQYILDVQLINQGNQQDSWEVGNKKDERIYKPGIRLSFNPKDDNFFAVSNLIVKELGLQSTRTNHSGRTIDIYDKNASQLSILSRKLQQEPYKYQVKPLNDAIVAFTGQEIEQVRKRVSDKVKSAPLSDMVVKSRIDANVYQTPINRDAFDEEVKQLYPGAFNSQFVGPKMGQAQRDGMFFIIGRGTSILADSPGAGKSVQAIVGADFATSLQDRETTQQSLREGKQVPPKKKILVFTPLQLVEEHWTSTDSKQSKPELYAGHDANSIVQIRSLHVFDKFGEHVRWVVIPYTTMSMSGDRNKIAVKIAQDAKLGMYGAVILDEIQTIKNLDSNQGEALRTAISAGGIKHRIGLTGTPADNEPSDLYAQLRVTRHPIIYDTDGTIQQTEKGFAAQFLGGDAYADKKNSAVMRIDSIFRWAREVNKQQLAELFSTTYIRRTKEDMKPELPAKDRNLPQIITGQEGHWQNRLSELKKDLNPQIAKNPYQSLEKEMAIAKIPYTVKSSITHLENTQNKLFIVTKYPDVAEMIAQQINARLGDGVAAQVSGDVTKETKQIVPNTFKEKNGVLKNKVFPLRCVIYTMKMGAIGLNFSMANKAIFNDIDWNPSNNLQAEDRVHRIDSPHASSIEYIYFDGTYDQDMFNRVRRKESVNRDVNNILREVSLYPDKINEISGKFILSLVDTLLFDVPMTPNIENYVNRRIDELKLFLKTPDKIHNLAYSGSWYTKFKTASCQ